MRHGRHVCEETCGTALRCWPYAERSALQHVRSITRARNKCPLDVEGAALRCVVFSVVLVPGCCAELLSDITLADARHRVRGSELVLLSCLTALRHAGGHELSIRATDQGRVYRTATQTATSSLAWGKKEKPLLRIDK